MDSFLELVSEFKPELIIVGNPFVEIKTIRSLLSQDSLTQNLNIYYSYCDMIIPKLYLKSRACIAEFEGTNFSDEIKLAISLARMQQLIN